MCRHFVGDAGQLRIALNSSALGPGDYQLMFEGLNWRGEATPEGWITISATFATLTLLPLAA